MDAARTYGYNTKPDLSSPLQEGVDTNTQGGFNVRNITWGHPLFWLLLLLLLIVAYVGFIFDISIKRVGEVQAKGGSKA
jgi:hypothetical protein